MTDPRLLRALSVIEELESRLQLSQGIEPVAVVGYACRFPGAESPEELWRLLCEGRCTVGDVPSDRWHGPSPFRSGGFLADVESFDANFFHISPREAVSLDPQHRLLLELTWEALERALIRPSSLRESSTGVFVAVGSGDYSLRRLYDSDKESVSVYDGTGTEVSFAPGRIAYTLGLNGPCLALNTACSSSLVAVHTAAQSLRARECDMAICGGAHLVLEPDDGYFLAASQALSPSGICRPFDSRADGFVRGEGGGVVLLKRLSEARENGDQILGVIAGSSINSDGASSGFTAPNGKAQEALIRRVLEKAGLKPDDLGFYECHGTGTNLGDPIELDAMGRALKGRTTPLPIGSIKANFGHLEAAAGMASLFKALLILEHGQVPPQIHFETPNPHIDWENLPFKVSTASPLKKPAVGLSGFGMSGTNAHLIVTSLEESPAPPPRRIGGPVVLPLSAGSPAALRALAQRYLEMDSPEIEDLCAGAALYREHLDYRLAVVARDSSQLKERLRSYLDRGESFGVWSGRKPAGGEPKVAFLFSGQATERAGMGEGLAGVSPSFKESLDSLRHQYDQLLPRTLQSVWGLQESLHETRFAQPALFCLELALARQWERWGVKPHCLFGHSIGEVAAATMAGVFDEGEAVRFVAQLSQLLSSLGDGSGMTTVWADPARLKAFLSNGLSLACENGPSLQTVAGPLDSMEELERKLREAGISFSRLPIGQAVHTKQLDPVVDEITEAAAGCQLRRPRKTIVTSRSGKIESGEMSSPRYWSDQFRYPVVFQTALDTLEKEAIDVYLEIGPQPTLVSQGKQSRPDTQAEWVGSLRPNRDEPESIACALAQLYCAGVDIDWSEFWSERPHGKVALPLYPWQKTRHWIESRRNHGDSLIRKLEEANVLTPAELERIRLALGESSTNKASIPAYAVEWEPILPGGEADLSLSLTGPDLALCRKWAEGIPGARVLSSGSLEPRQALSGMKPDEVLLYLCFGCNDAAELFASITETLGTMTAGKLWLVTKGGAPMAESYGHWLQGAVWGFGQTAALEYPDRWGGLLDLTTEEPIRWSRPPEGEDLLAIRGSSVLAARLQPISLNSAKPSLQADKRYLITGGLSGLGLEAAHSLADFGARDLVLLGRTERESERLEALKERGVRVRFAFGDVADPEILRGLPPVDGIVHAAGTTSDGLLRNLKDADYDRVFRGKVGGLQNLVRHYGSGSLDFLIAFSSGASLFGHAGQANYGAANAALAAVAREARHRGLPATVLHWGAWAVGMTGRLDEHLRERITRSGFQLFAASQMSRLLGSVLGAGKDELMVAGIDWEQFARSAPAQAARAFFPVQVEPEEEPTKDISALVEDEVRRVLNLTAEQYLNRDEGFFKLGLDSLMAAELAASLAVRLSLKVTAATILDNPSLNSLSEFLDPRDSETNTDADLERLLEQKFQSVIGHRHQQ